LTYFKFFLGAPKSSEQSSRVQKCIVGDLSPSAKPFSISNHIAAADQSNPKPHCDQKGAEVRIPPGAFPNLCFTYKVINGTRSTALMEP